MTHKDTFQLSYTQRHVDNCRVKWKTVVRISSKVERPMKEEVKI